jgi:ribosome maturation factor RimP
LIGLKWNDSRYPMKQSAKTKSLTDLITPAVAACNVELWGIEFLQQGRRSLLRIYIDKPIDQAADQVTADAVPTVVSLDGDDEDTAGLGIGVQDCVAVNHQVSGVLDVHDPIAGEYSLEVSSPGWDRPFFHLHQMQHYIGQTVALRLISPVKNRRKLNGELLMVDEQGIRLMFEDEAVDIEADNIDKAHLVYQD